MLSFVKKTIAVTFLENLIPQFTSSEMWKNLTSCHGGEHQSDNLLLINQMDVTVPDNLEWIEVSLYFHCHNQIMILDKNTKHCRKWTSNICMKISYYTYF